MITKEEIDKILSGYDPKKIKIATICSHSALQIFHGAKQEGFKTVGICVEDRKSIYNAFPLAKPDELLLVEEFKEVLTPELQNKLVEDNVIIIPHGSFVEYVGAEALGSVFRVTMFGNRETLEWESDRAKQRIWLEKAGLRMLHKNEFEVDGLQGHGIVAEYICKKPDTVSD